MDTSVENLYLDIGAQRVKGKILVARLVFTPPSHSSQPLGLLFPFNYLSLEERF